MNTPKNYAETAYVFLPNDEKVCIGTRRDHGPIAPGAVVLIIATGAGIKTPMVIETWEFDSFNKADKAAKKFNGLSVHSLRRRTS